MTIFITVLVVMVAVTEPARADFRASQLLRQTLPSKVEKPQPQKQPPVMNCYCCRVKADCKGAGK